MSTDTLFDDPALKRIDEEGNDSTTDSNLIIRIQHKDSGPITSNFTRVTTLMEIENSASGQIPNNYSFDAEKVYIKRLETPFSAWEGAFQSRNKSILNSSNWGEVLQPVNEQGWCGEDANEAENNALEATLLLLPKGSNVGIACPEFSGASATQSPQANELLWLVWLDSSERPVDWLELSVWCEKLSANSEFDFEPAGVNMLFKEAEVIAKEDLNNILPIAAILLTAILLLFFKDLKVTITTISSVGLVVTSTIGFLGLFGYNFTVIDAIAIPIIMGIAVDGVFWYKTSNKSREEARSILLLAMATTIAAVSLALFSPIKAQRGLALVMIIGIFLDWVFTRYVLEDFFINSRNQTLQTDTIGHKPPKNIRWLWPTSLLILIVVAVTSPPGVEALDINQFMPEDNDSLDELSELRNKYVIASSTIVFLTVDINQSDSEEMNNLWRFKEQFEQHPNIISYDTGIAQKKLVLGMGDIDQNSNFNMLVENTSDSIVIKDPWLRTDGQITGGLIIAVIDGEDSEAAYQFSLDSQNLLADNNLSGEVGGQLITGITLAKSFEQTRILQILFAGFTVFAISYLMTGSVKRSARIAVGTIAIGICVDGLASRIGGRGVNTAPAVLLGMGFAADYLSHASDQIKTSKHDNYARWGAAITSGFVFFIVSFSRFPPARNTGILLSLTILISVILATILAYVRDFEEIEPPHIAVQEE